ncbi:unnamed protein product [Prunus armeniaca]|uniref:Uncharacterized protein n=1 Tax=Prunus armeniaca TaxID=36596 RepID=A0A6J5XVK7_PRUAR|nr:unnamed protein product [Prunus armeniaca]
MHTSKTSGSTFGTLHRSEYPHAILCQCHVVVRNEARKFFNIKLELSSVLKKAEDGSYPNATDIVATYKNVGNDLGSVLSELNSLRYRTSFPDIEGNSHTTANPTTVLAAVSPTISSGNPPSVLVAAMTPSPAAISPTISSESVTTDASTSEVDVEMGMQLQSTNRQEERRGVSH